MERAFGAKAGVEDEGAGVQEDTEHGPDANGEEDGVVEVVTGRDWPLLIVHEELGPDVNDELGHGVGDGAEHLANG